MNSTTLPITVLGRNTSSNVQKVMWLLSEIGQVCTRIDMGGKYGGNREEAYLKKNPNGVVPTLLHGNAVIWESNTILRYIASAFSEPVLYPQDVLGKAHVERWMDWQLSTFGPVNALLYQSIIRTPENLRKPDVIELHRVRNEQSVKLLDDILSEREFIAGIEFTLADIAIGPLIHRWFNLPVERPEYKFVRRWYDAISERSAFIEHVKSIPFS